jgi:hypothetical protein
MSSLGNSTTFSQVDILILLDKQSWVNCCVADKGQMMGSGIIALIMLLMGKKIISQLPILEIPRESKKFPLSVSPKQCDQVFLVKKRLIFC